MPQPHLTPGKDPVPIVQGAGWTSGPVWTGAENLGIRSPDRPARRQSLYRLRYLAHCIYIYIYVKVKFTLEQATKTRGGGGSRCIALYSFFNLGARWGVFNVTPRPLYSRERDPVPIYWRLGGTRAHLYGCGISRPHRDLIPGPSSS